MSTTALRDVTLDDKYTLARGRVFMTGVQALVRLPLEQRRRDVAAGRNTAGYVTGYRGSPLGAYDQQLERAKGLLTEHHVVHQPGVNEDLAATAVQGTQQAGLAGEGRYDGVFAVWYGKGPGVDRSGDAIRHGNLFGTAPLGGVLLLLGDDHTCESSTTAHQSEYAMVDAMVPVLNPSGVARSWSTGCSGSRCRGSRAPGCRSSASTTRSRAPHRSRSGRRARRSFCRGLRPARERAQHPGLPGATLAAAGAGGRAAAARPQAGGGQGLRAGEPDRPGGAGRPWAGRHLTLVTTGKSWQDVVAALDELGLDEARAEALGLRVYKVGMTYPLEPEGLQEAVAGSGLVMVVEEKRGLIEGQAKEILYDLDDRPRLIGKRDERGEALFPSHGALDSLAIAEALARRLVELTGRPAAPGLAARAGAAPRAAGRQPGGAGAAAVVLPGLPAQHEHEGADGSKAVAGIGCHFMTTWMGRETTGFTQMGGEGASWLGMAPFSTRGHVFQNIGDGTFYHSGSLSIRAAKAAGANITYKILYNDAVAMTGGQRMETANLAVPQVARLLEARGSRRSRSSPTSRTSTGWTPASLRRAGPLPRRAGRGAAAAARGPGRLGDHLRPDLRRGEAPPAQARRVPRPGPARGHQRAGLRGLRRLRRAVELRRRAARRDRVRPQAADRPVGLQQGLLLPEGLLPVLRHRARRQSPERLGWCGPVAIPGPARSDPA
jgi:indolepyruvate ferredoxin oxidoreductase